MSEYELPKVWQWENENDEVTGNRPSAGVRFEQNLPVGDASLQVYSLPTPNGQKVAIMLEELKEAGHDVDYDMYQIHIGEGDQFGSDFVGINPNSKIPAMVDQSVGGGLNLFESGSILQYLAEKYEQFLPSELSARTETLNWLFWQIGSAPYVGGGFGHFFRSAPELMKYPIDRFTMETKRQLDLLDKHLADREFIAAGQFTVADMAIWPWYGKLALGDLYDGSAKFLNVSEYPNLIAWAEKIAERPGVKKGLEVEYKAIK